jgi:hypothetical protein
MTSSTANTHENTHQDNHIYPLISYLSIFMLLSHIYQYLCSYLIFINIYAHISYLSIKHQYNYHFILTIPSNKLYCFHFRLRGDF